jgi:membrane protein implicated in regulation of membrane protease activity
MFDNLNTLDAIFLGAFLFGLLFSVVALALGAVDFGADHGGHIGHDADGGLHDFLNVSVILAFIAWFGGVGYLASSGAGWTAAVSVVVAVGGGLIGAYIILQIFKRVIRPAGNTELDPRDYELKGKLARVTSSIRPGGVGEIVYEQSGARMVRAARSSSGIAIPRGTEVVVLRAEGGVGIVAPWAELYGDDPLPEIPPHEPISGNGSHPGATSVLETGAPATLRKNSDGTNE